jgi:hypothetical protein
MEWEAEGGCEAACPEHCWIEQDGHFPFCAMNMGIH